MKTILILLLFPCICLAQTRKRNDYQWDKYVMPLMDSIQKATQCKIYYEHFCAIKKETFTAQDSVTRIYYNLSRSDLGLLYDGWKNNLLPVPEVWREKTYTENRFDIVQQPKTSIYAVSLPIFIQPNVYMIQTWMMRRCNSALGVIYIVEYNEQAQKIKVRYSKVVAP